MPKNQYVRLRDDVYESAKYLLHEQSSIISGVPGTAATITGYVNEVLINDLAKRGHYPPKAGVKNG